MKLVEVTGSLGSGKTVLTQKLAAQLASRGVSVRVVRVGGQLAADPSTIPWAPLFAARNPRLFRLVVSAAVRDADSFRARLALLWNMARKAGMSVRLESTTDAEVVIWDEGAVHMAHNAFAHAGCTPRPTEVLEFGDLVPKPDELICVRASRDVALARVLSRGHRRTGGDVAATTSLLTNAERVFGLLAQVDSLRDRMTEVQNDTDDPADLDLQVAAIARRVLREDPTGTR